MMRPRSRLLDYPPKSLKESTMRNWILLIIGSVLVTGLYAAAPRTSGGNKDEQEIRALEKRFAAAFRAKDVPPIIKGYPPVSELFVFYLSPPPQVVAFDSPQK